MKYKCAVCNKGKDMKVMGLAQHEEGAGHARNLARKLRELAGAALPSRLSSCCLASNNLDGSSYKSAHAPDADSPGLTDFSLPCQLHIACGTFACGQHCRKCNCTASCQRLLHCLPSMRLHLQTRVFV